MVKFHTMVGTFLLMLGLACSAPLLGVQNAPFGANSAFAATARPTQADLNAAITRIEAVGNYKTYFKNSSAELTSDVPYYQEYNYLHTIATDLAYIRDHYYTTSDQDLIAVLEAADYAVTGCRLKLGIVRAEIAESKKVTTNSSTTSSTTNSATTKPATSTSSSNTNTSASVSTNKTTSQTQTASTATSKPKADVESSTPTVSTTETTHSSLDTVPATDVDDIDVPATGEVDTPVSFNALAVLAAIIVSGAVLSVLLTIIIHRQPRHHHSRRR